MTVDQAEMRRTGKAAAHSEDGAPPEQLEEVVGEREAEGPGETVSHRDGARRGASGSECARREVRVEVRDFGELSGVRGASKDR